MSRIKRNVKQVAGKIVEIFSYAVHGYPYHTPTMEEKFEMQRLNCVNSIQEPRLPSKVRAQMGTALAKGLTRVGPYR